MKKKYGLFKVLACLLLIVTVLTWFIKGREDAVSYLALGDALQNYMQSFYYFFDTILFVLVVGGFYGFLNRVPAYKKLVRGFAEKVSAKSKLFVIIVTIIFALISSLTGLNVLLFIFVPFIISVILLLGYDKLVAISSTIGGIVIGIISGIFLTLKEAASDYSGEYIYSTIDKFVGLDGNYVTLIPRIILLVIGIGLLIFYIINHIKKVDNGDVAYELSKGDNLFVEMKDRTGKKITLKNDEVATWRVVTLIVILSLLLVLLVLGYFPWNGLFKIEVFNKFHEWLIGLKVGNYAVFTSLISANIGAFGTWGSLGNYMAAMLLLVVFTFILMLVNKIKFEEAMDGFLYGVKKMLPAAMLVALAYAVLVCSYNNGFLETIISFVSDKLGDNVLVHSLITLFGSVLSVDLYYASSAVFTPLVTSLSKDANLSVYALMLQNLYGLVQFVGPTSILLLASLSYLEVPYKTWLKYIWRFVLALFIIIFITLMVVSLI